MKYFKRFSIFETKQNSKDSIQIVEKINDNRFHSFDILFNNEVVGKIECYFVDYELEIAGIEVHEEFRNKGIGNVALKKLKKFFKPLKIEADCTSLQSFYTFVKAYGNPKYMDSIFKRFKTYSEVENYLPKFTHYNGSTMIGSTDSAVHVIF